MRRHLVALSVALLLLSRLCADSDAVRLVFDPKPGQEYVVHYVEDMEWELTGQDARGELHCELTLRWRFQKGEHGLQGRAAIDRVVYRRKQAKDEDCLIDLEWNRTGGYVRTKGAGPDAPWSAKEMEDGVTLSIAPDATCASAAG